MPQFFLEAALTKNQTFIKIHYCIEIDYSYYPTWSNKEKKNPNNL